MLRVGEYSVPSRPHHVMIAQLESTSIRPNVRMISEIRDDHSEEEGPLLITLTFLPTILAAPATSEQSRAGERRVR